MIIPVLKMVKLKYREVRQTASSLDPERLASEYGILATIQIYLQHSTPIGFTLHTVKLQMKNAHLYAIGKQKQTDSLTSCKSVFVNIFLLRSYAGPPAVHKDKEFRAVLQLHDAKC